MLFGNRVSHFPPFSCDEDDPAKECDDLRQRKVGVLLRRQTRMPVTSTSGAAHNHPRLYKADDHLKTLLQNVTLSVLLYKRGDFNILTGCRSLVTKIKDIIITDNEQISHIVLALCNAPTMRLQRDSKARPIVTC